MPGTLFLCATPIGNLKDITERVLETLKSVSLIAAEDTRNSMKLLNHFDIHVPLTSYHEYNKYDKAEELIGHLMSGQDIALITDAGTPAISDPGEVLVQKCIEAGIKVTSLPGACAAITALTLSGLSARRFSFEGFLPAENKDRRAVLEELKNEYRTMVLYEAPHHLSKTLKDLFDALGDRRISICRELTKIHEEAVHTTLSAALMSIEDKKPRGEYVLVLEGKDREAEKAEKIKGFEELSIAEHLETYEKQGMDRKEAMKAVAKDRGVQKRDIYKAFLSEEELQEKKDGESGT